MMELSISIVNFNAKEPLRLCLRSIEDNIKNINYEVIAVDNASRDGSIEMLKNDFSFVKVIVNNENSGATVAKNQSFKEAQGRYILILDSDIEILPGAVEAMVDFLNNNPQAGIVGPRVMFPNFRPQHSCNKSFPNLWGIFLNRIFFFASLRYRFYRSKIGSVYLNLRYNRIEEFAWLGGMCLLARREILQQLNGMDENFFIYYDDTDLCLRAKKHNWKIYYLPSASVVHHLSQSVGKFSDFLFPKIYESELYFFKKHYGVFKEKICAVLIQLSMLLRIAPSYIFVFSGFKKDYFKTRIASYRQVFFLARESINAAGD
jgi:GT2 family glycosyltransferase